MFTDYLGSALPIADCIGNVLLVSIVMIPLIAMIIWIIKECVRNKKHN